MQYTKKTKNITQLKYTSHVHN